MKVVVVTEEDTEDRLRWRTLIPPLTGRAGVKEEGVNTEGVWAVGSMWGQGLAADNEDHLTL